MYVCVCEQLFKHDTLINRMYVHVCTVPGSHIDHQPSEGVQVETQRSYYYTVVYMYVHMSTCMHELEQPTQYS